jgi:protein involved in polysaccharide export with SLBB domain
MTGNVDEWAGSREDLLLQDGDSLQVPKRAQEVLVLGEIYSPGARVFEPGMTVKDYIERSGGFTRNSEEDQVFVVQANGFAFGADSPKGHIEGVKLRAGDAVFVPQKLERHATMRLTRDIVDILFKTAVVIATITILF